MCGRFTSKASGREIEKEFALETGSSEANGALNTARYNIAPAQMNAAVRQLARRQPQRQ